VKINQYCSVCKQHLDMEVIPTDDAGDDGVIWLRCPQCQGFLPKFSGSLPPPAPSAPVKRALGADQDEKAAPAEQPGERRAGRTSSSQAAPKAAAEDRDEAAESEPDGDTDLEELDRGSNRVAAPAAAAEPIAAYAAMLGEADLTKVRPYRASEAYAVGDVIHHLAYGTVGIVVGKEKLPGGRLAVKVYFEDIGIVRLIEQATEGY
jgi:hypothetical protein